MNFDQELVGPVRSAERGFELRWGSVVEVAVQPGGAVPVHPSEGGQLDVFDGSSTALVVRVLRPDEKIEPPR